MTDDTNRPKPQRLQPHSQSPMADGAQAPAPVKRAPGRPPKAQAAPNAIERIAENAAAGRAPLTAPTENQLEALRPRAEEMRDQIQNFPDDNPATHGRVSGGDRVPFGNQQAKMAVPERDGFTRRWFNDEPGRIQRALRAGYKHVLEEDGSGRNKELTVSKSANQGVKAFCMEIPNEFYDEDFAHKQEALDIVDMQIYTGTNNQQPGDSRYVPRDQMKMRVKHGPGSHIP